MSQKNHFKVIFSLLLVIVITWLVAWWYEPKLPQKVPTHWNIEGEVDGWTEKPWGVYLLPLISTITSLFMMLLPKLAPKGFKLASAQTIYQYIVLIMAIFMLAVMVLTFEASLNHDIDVNQWVMVGVGTLFILIGNYLSKVPKNFFLGIRTPWTLASDEVWYKTHRMGAWMFILSGLLTVLGGLLHWPTMALIIILSAAGLIPVIYSLVVYKNVEGFDE